MENFQTSTECQIEMYTAAGVGGIGWWVNNTCSDILNSFASNAATLL